MSRNSCCFLFHTVIERQARLLPWPEAALIQERQYANFRSALQNSPVLLLKPVLEFFLPFPFSLANFTRAISLSF